MRERIEHTNRIKGLLMSQGISGFDPLYRLRFLGHRIEPYAATAAV